MPTLYELSDKYLRLLDTLSQEEELTEDQMQLLLDNQDAIKDKLDAYGIVIAELTNKTDLISAEKKRLGDWQKRIENHISRMKQAIVATLQSAELERFETNHWRFSFRKSISVEVDDGFIRWASKYGREDLLRMAEPIPDKKAIKEAIEYGNDMLPARIVESKNLQIR